MISFHAGQLTHEADLFISAWLEDITVDPNHAFLVEVEDQKVTVHCHSVNEEGYSYLDSNREPVVEVPQMFQMPKATIDELLNGLVRHKVKPEHRNRYGKHEYFWDVIDV